MPEHILPMGTREAALDNCRRLGNILGTERILHGQQITVDGGAGTVSILAADNERN